jgi:hypothetical protein
MKKILMFSGLLLVGFASFAQETPRPRNKKEEKRKRIDAIIRQEEEGVITYKKHVGFGGKFTSDGYALFMEKGKALSIRKAMLYQFELGERKHQKEAAITSFQNGISFIYGKINYVYPVKLGMQQQYLLGNKTNKNGVSLTANYGGGLCLGLLRPYEVEVDKNGQNVFIRYESADSLLFINQNAIIGGPTLGKGWNGMKISPGAYAKTSLRFDYGKYNELLSGLEVGISAEFYGKKIPQMVYSKQHNFFFTAYVGLMFGKRK